MQKIFILIHTIIKSFKYKNFISNGNTHFMNISVLCTYAHVYLINLQILHSSAALAAIQIPIILVRSTFIFVAFDYLTNTEVQRTVIFFDSIMVATITKKLPLSRQLSKLNDKIMNLCLWQFLFGYLWFIFSCIYCYPNRRNQLIDFIT